MPQALREFWGGEEEAGDEEGEGFRTRVARTIVVVSILGALVSWQASRSSENADDFNQEAMTAFNFAEVTRDGIRAGVAHDFGLVGELEESVMRKRLIGQAIDAGFDSQSLRVERLQELRRHQMMRQFLAVAGTDDSLKRLLGYDPDFVREEVEAGDPTLRDIRPGKAQAQGQEARSQSVSYVRSAAMLALSLFFLTLATLTGPGLRTKMAAGGLAVAILAMGLFVAAW